MKNFKLFTSSLAALMLSATAMAPTVAHAEASGSVGISNFYLWRGLDLSNDGEGGSAPAVWGDLSVSADWGGYAGVWASSGDEVLGQEYDLYAGWGSDFGAFSLDISYWTYNYPSFDIEPSDVADLVVGVGFGDFGVTLYEAIAGEGEGINTRYVTFDYSFGDFNALVGIHDLALEDNPTHVQLGYAYNDNLSFTVSKFVEDADEAVDDSVLFNVGYSISF